MSADGNGGHRCILALAETGAALRFGKPDDLFESVAVTFPGLTLGVHGVRRMIALALACVAAALLYDYPVFRPLLGGFLLVYAGLMFRWPRVWLAVLPACVPLLQLAHWSGRLFLEDLDIVFVFTLAVLLWQTPAPATQRRIRLPPAIHLVVFALAVSYLASLVIGLLPWPDWRAPDFLASFLSPANALRESKGFFWAVLLSPFVFRAFREHPVEARRMVVVGMLVGGAVTGVMALWERGVWQALMYGRDIYQILGPLLDFSTSYRVTGTFAEMHTGGEAIDGYLGLAWPMMVLALVLSRRPLTLVLSSLVLGLVIYSLVTTFSRGLYFSLAVAGGLGLAGLMRASYATTGSGKTVRLVSSLLPLGAGVLLMGYGYSRGGVMGLASTMLMLWAAAWLAWRPMTRGINSGLFMVAFCLCAWAAARGMLTSKWHPLELEVAAPLALLLIGGTGLLGHVAGRLLPRGDGIKPYLVVVVILVVGGTLAPAILGFRMTERFSSVDTDFSTRTEHWRHILSLKNGRLMDQVLGMGTGSFPREYHWDNANRPEGSGNFTLMREAGNTFLRTAGGKDLRFGQRLSIDAMEPAQLRLRVRTPSPKARLKIRLCRRFVIHPTEWNGQCVTYDHAFSSTHGQWREIVFNFDTGQIGDGLQMARPPLMLEINNRREYDLLSSPPAVVDLDDIRLTDGRGRMYVANGDFERGMDRWLPYYDFNHLPWHVKNIWLHLYFEQGVLGVIAFAASWMAALFVAWQAAARGEVFPVGVAAALTGFVAVGTFGSPIDAPRVAWLYYFLFFVLIAQYGKARPPPPHHGRRHSPTNMVPTR